MSSVDNRVLAYYYGFNIKPMKIREKCETLFQLQKNSKKTFDTGMYGTIAEVCLKSDCRYILKMIPFSNPAIYQTFLREALIAPLMSKNGIGPKIHDIFVCLNAGFIIMEKFDGSLRNIINSDLFSWKYLISISDMINKMHDLNVVHNDLHTANILYRVKKNGEYEFRITDFGLALYFENREDIIPMSFLPVTSIPDIYFPSYDFFKFSIDLENKLGRVFIQFFFIKGYLTLIDYVLLQKFYGKIRGIYPITFFQFLKDEKINKDRVKEFEKNNGKANVLMVESKIDKYKERETRTSAKKVSKDLESNIRKTSSSIKYSNKNNKK